MSLLLRSPRSATNFIVFVSRAKLALRKRKIFPSLWRLPFQTNDTFVRSCAVAHGIQPSLAQTSNIQENLYQKAISQVYFDIQYKGFIVKEDFIIAWHTLNSSTTFTVEQTLLLIKSCGHKMPLEAPSERLKLVREVWDSFDHVGVKKGIAHYNALLNVYIELEHKFSPKQFLSELEKKGLVPNQETYSQLVHALSKQGNIGQSAEILDHMKMNSISIGDEVFNSLILGYSLEGNFQTAQGILNLMEEKGLMVSSKSYASLAQGYAKLGDVEKVKEVIDKCKEQKRTLSTLHLLELAYTFAVNGYSEHFSATLDMIRLTKSFTSVSIIFIHRLLHRNLDAEASKLFEMGNTLRSVHEAQETLKLFLDHYVRFREPEQVLDVAKAYTQKGLSPIAFAYCLKETLIRKDICHCLNFLDATYKSGNEAVLGMLKTMKKYQVTIGREAMKNFSMFYDFLPGRELEDFEKLTALGLSKELVGWKILDILLTRQDVNNAIKLVSMCGIAHPAVLLPKSLAYAFIKHENDHQRFLYIFNYLIHNIKANKMKFRLQEEVKPVEYEQFIFHTGQSLDKEFNIAILEGMLKRKIPLSTEAASYLWEQFSCPRVAALTSQLTSPGFKFAFDETLLKRLIGKANFKENKEFSGENETLSDWSQLQVALTSGVEVGVVMNMFEGLANETEFSNNKEHQNITRNLLMFVSREGDVASTEKVYELGVRKNLIEARDYAPCFIARLVRGDVSGAVKRFNTAVQTTEKLSSLGTLIKAIKDSNKLLYLEDLWCSMSKAKGEDSASALFLIEFAKLGCVSEARKIFRSRIEISKPLLRNKVRRLFRRKQVTYLETLEKAARSSDKVNVASFHNFLVKLYAQNGSLEKVLNLYVELERDDAKTEDSQKIFCDFLEKWGGEVPKELKKVLHYVREDCKEYKSLRGKKTAKIFGGLSQERSVLQSSREDMEPSFDRKKEPQQQVSSANKLFKCFCLLHAGHINGYFTVLKKSIAVNGPKEATDYFFCYKLVPHLMKNRTHLNTYKNLVKKCDLPDLWIKYLKVCLRLGNLKEVKEVMVHFKPSQLAVYLEEVAIEDCLRAVEREECYQQLGEKIFNLYLRIINQFLRQNKLEMAKKYYEKANEHKLGSFLTSFVDDDLLKI